MTQLGIPPTPTDDDPGLAQLYRDFTGLYRTEVESGS